MEPTNPGLRPINHGQVVDIGGSAVFDDVRDRLVRTLESEYNVDNKLALPDELLYDDVGLNIWAKIISTKEFYQTADEIAIFDRHGASVVKRLESNVTMIDLGAGDTAKVEHFLAQAEKVGRAATYFALDISKDSLDKNINFLVNQHNKTGSVVKCCGLWGTFKDGMNFVQQIQTPRLFLSLGSVLCNDPWPEALNHLKFWANELRPNDYLLVGMDGHLLPKDEDKIWDAYHSREDLFTEFFMNGFQRLNQVAGEEWFREQDWYLKAELELRPTTRHRFYLRAKRDLVLPNLCRAIKEGVEFDWFDSHKYSENDVRLMCRKAGLTVIEVYKAPNSEFRQYLLKTRGEGDQKDDADSAVSGLS